MLKRNIESAALAEYERAFNLLLSQYNTTIRENRFLTGGAVEVFTCGLLRSVGVDCQLYGSQAKHGDLILPNNKQLSIKGVFTGGANSVGLINKQGEGARVWQTATLFIVSKVGIVYGAPDMIDSSEIKDLSHQIQLTKKGLSRLISDKKNVLEANLDSKPPTAMAGNSLKASTAAAKRILQEAKSTILISQFNKEL